MLGGGVGNEYEIEKELWRTNKFSLLETLSPCWEF